MMLANYESYLPNFQILLSINFISMDRYFECKSKLFVVTMKVITKQVYFLLQIVINLSYCW